MNINRVESSVTADKIRSLESYAPKAISSQSDIKTNVNEQKINDQKAQEYTKEQQAKLEEQIKKLNESIAASGKELKFKYNDEAHELYVEVLNSETKEVVSSLPPEFLIDLSLKMKEMIGMFFDEKI
ncbi:flagellar protein FlaG [Paenibacillus segetis]|uniref:Flagellar protein FlaG n=1 Tax=Paenibacillus segetis TaxID=1325360 RepID=A0ABQ1YNQ8_9BACL|nr:flagellar protein FlaG [Paenibacillus segetis]GGH33012.1 hypothetical protein GCM10008013_37790 [Paenibacillus segetis]